MFHPTIIQNTIDRIQLKTGLKLREYTVEECVKVYEHFQSMTQTDGKRVWYQRPSQTVEQFTLAKWEEDWISNELYMCASSFPYWFFRYFFIKTKEGRIQRPDVLVAQRIFLDILSELDLKQLPIMLLILKARQLGMSTITEAIILWIALFRRGCHTVISSAEEEKSEQMSNMVWVGLENLPVWMQPVLTRDDRKKGPEFGNTDSDILIQHGSMTKGISRGDTPIAAHLSECAYYPDPVETIESSLIRAMHENPRTFLVLESTARKKGDWWHRTWVNNREGEQEGYNRFTCLFLPWYVGTDKYPTSDFLRNHPIPRGWKPLDVTNKQATDARLYVATTPLLQKYLGKGWVMPREQMWFWEFNYVEAKREDETYKSFLAEMASDERSAFQSKKWSVFTPEVLERLEKGIESKYVDYAVVGDGIDPKFSLREYQSPSAKRVDISWATIKDTTLHWKLIPLKETPADDKLQFYLRVWERPKPGYSYTIGVDISSGTGQNRTVYDVLRVGKRDEPALQVAQLCSPWISSPESPAFANALGIWYGQHMSPVPEALMCPEVQIAVGDPISYQLSELGYTNFFYMTRYDQRKHPNSKPTRRGWATVAWSRQLMMETYKHAIDTGWVIINSEETLLELNGMEEEELDSGKMKYDHEKDNTDDCYMAGGIAYFCSYDKETIMERMHGKIKPKKVSDAKEDRVEIDSTEAMLARHFQREELEEMEGADDENWANIF